MPFITQKRRKPLDPLIERLAATCLVPSDCDTIYQKFTTENVTYVVYKLMVLLYGSKNHSWWRKGEVSKVLHAAQLAFDEYIMTPHENEKRAENGDVT